VGAVFDTMAATVTEGQTSTRIQRQLASQLGEMRAQYRRAGAELAIPATGECGQPGRAGAGRDAGGAGLLAGDPATVQQLQLQWGDYVHGLQDLTPDQRMALVAEKVPSIALALGAALLIAIPSN
jgi:hypothetical protein